MTTTEQAEMTNEQKHTMGLLWNAYHKAANKIDQSRYQPNDLLLIREVLECSLIKTLIDMCESRADSQCNYHISTQAYSFLVNLLGFEINLLIGDVKWIQRVGEHSHSKNYLDKWFDDQKNIKNSIELEITRQFFCYPDFDMDAVLKKSVNSNKTNLSFVYKAVQVCECSDLIGDNVRFNSFKSFVMGYLKPQ